MHIRSKGILAAAVLMVTLPGMASAAVIGFEGLDAGALQTVPLTTFTESGFTFALTWTGNGKGPAIFDSTCKLYALNGRDGCNGDLDLSPKVQGENGVSGNILINQEDKVGAPTPNDEASAGSITLELLSGSAFVFKGASAVDDGTFTFSTSKDGVLGSIKLTKDRETGKITFASPSSVLGIGDKITISYSGSGGVDSLVLTPVPLPASMALLVAGLGGLGLMRRRKVQSA